MSIQLLGNCRLVAKQGNLGRWQCVNGLFERKIWRFPKIGVPPKSSILMGCSISNHLFWDTPHLWKPLYSADVFRVVRAQRQQCGAAQASVNTNCFVHTSRWGGGVRPPPNICGPPQATLTREQAGSACHFAKLGQPKNAPAKRVQAGYHMAPSQALAWPALCLPSVSNAREQVN